MAVSCPNHPEVVEDLSECAGCCKTFCQDCIITLNGRTTCAACKSQNLRDIRSGNPERYSQAGRGARLVAIILDGLITGTVGSILFAMVVGAQRSTGVRLGPPGQPPHIDWGIIVVKEVFLVLLLPSLYEGLMLVRYQASLGKKALGIKVVNADGGRMTTKQAWGRVGSRYLCMFVPILGLVDVLMIFSHRKLCLHDRMADTMVIRKNA